MLINAGRGDLIIDDDLIAALENGQLGNAVLDVFREEPLPPDHPFWTCKNLTITPHVSGWTEGMLAARAKLIADNIERIALGEPALNAISHTS